MCAQCDSLDGPRAQGLPSRREDEQEVPCRSSPASLFQSLLQRCLRDILDGFFPSELQRLYPDGVPFKVMGCSSNHPVWGFWKGRGYTASSGITQSEVGATAPPVGTPVSDDLREEGESEARLRRGYSCPMSKGSRLWLRGRQCPLLAPGRHSLQPCRAAAPPQHPGHPDSLGSLRCYAKVAWLAPEAPEAI